MVKAASERYQNKEGPFKLGIRVIIKGDKEKESLSFLSNKRFYNMATLRDTNSGSMTFS